MSQLRAALDDYLQIRRALGFKLKRAGQLLPQFVAYLERAGAETITTDLAVAWATQPQDAHPEWWAHRLSEVRGFARHLQALDPQTEVPPDDLMPRQACRATPYLYSEAEIAALMQAARALRPSVRAATYETLVGLLTVTGMRVGEAIRLDRNDLDWNSGLLTVRNSKFGKSRQVPLHHSVVDALAAYARRRDTLSPRTESFFVSIKGTRLIYQGVDCTFLRLVRAAGLRQRSAACRPRLHDLRHTFAVRTLLDWYRAGLDVEARLPLLSTYLGHFEPSGTYWYLSASPELMALASQRLERALEERQ